MAWGDKIVSRRGAAKEFLSIAAGGIIGTEALAILTAENADAQDALPSLTKAYEDSAALFPFPQSSATQTREEHYQALGSKARTYLTQIQSNREVINFNTYSEVNLHIDNLDLAKKTIGASFNVLAARLDENIFSFDIELQRQAGTSLSVFKLLTLSISTMPPGDARRAPLNQILSDLMQIHIQLAGLRQALAPALK